MKQSRKTLLIHEPLAARRRLYIRHITARGGRIAAALNEQYDAALVSLPEAPGPRANLIAVLQRLTASVPVVVLDSHSFNETEFGGLPIRAHLERSATSLREVVAHAMQLLSE